jgi:hypothetical protein
MNTTPSDTRAAAMRMLLAPAPDELSAHLAAGVDRLPAMLEQIRPDDPGAADRCERLAGQFDGLRLQALRLASALQTRSAV